MLDKAYNPADTEDAIYKRWEESGAFTPEACDPKGEPFTISMPPPNATGQLHLGHAVMLALEDIFIRFQRMRGKRALWVPGTDHAAIATESVVIKKLQKEGMKNPRKELGREKLIETIAEFVEQSKSTIRSQIRKMGASCDWSRERYTFEPTLNRVVNEVFKKMYDDGLIYRGHRIVNWDPKLQTTVSDDELVYKEEKAVFYTFKYGPFEIATARPETKFGDKYVVMHPKDKRYSQYKHGETFDAEWINGSVRATVIKDEAIDMEFGTGVMTITPWHDHTDFEIAERHGLEKEQIIGFDGKLLDAAGEFAGMKIEEARPLIAKKLEEKGLLVKTDENYVHNKAVSQRGGGGIEPQIKLQWFIDVQKPVVAWKKKKMSLKEILHDTVHHGDIEIIPERFTKTYFHWIDNLRDWCISRQIWWGHRVPVWYKGDETIASAESPGAGFEQDPDTLDTWFSSAFWTWSTLIDKKLAEDPSLSLEDLLKRSADMQFHPTSVMETGYDILFFWVARMILMTTYAVGEIPFKTVYLHGLIRTRDGRKMSKSDPDTMIDPLDMIRTYGADALRLSMIVGQSPGNDSRLYEEKIAGYRNFINKLWNASRFVLMQCEEAKIDPSSISDVEDPKILDLKDKWLVEELRLLHQEVTEGLSKYRLSEVGDKLYSFVWDYFCDWYLEFSKTDPNPELLVYAIRQILVMLHPFCPFVTEELWQHFKHKESSALISYKWKEKLYSDKASEKVARQMRSVQEFITAVRRIRSDNDIPASTKINVVGIVESKDHFLDLNIFKEQITRMCAIANLDLKQKKEKVENSAQAITTDAIIFVALEGLFDPAKLKAGLEKERDNLASYVSSISGKMKNKKFVDSAPKEIVEAEKQKLAEAEEKLKKIEERVQSM